MNSHPQLTTFKRLFPLWYVVWFIPMALLFTELDLRQLGSSDLFFSVLLGTFPPALVSAVLHKAIQKYRRDAVTPSILSSGDASTPKGRFDGASLTLAFIISVFIMIIFQTGALTLLILWGLYALFKGINKKQRHVQEHHK